MFTDYSDTVCGAVAKVHDYSKCHKESEYSLGIITINIYMEIEECAPEAKAVVHDGNIRDQLMRIILGVSAGVLFIFCCGIMLCCRTRKRKKKRKMQNEKAPQDLGASLVSSGDPTAIKDKCSEYREAINMN